MPKIAKRNSGAVVSREDKRLVDHAVSTIESLYRRRLLDTVVAVGDYLIETFFDGSLELAFSHHPSKPAALRHLYDRIDELPLSLHLLRLSVRISAQWRVLSEPAAEALDVSHHELLLLVDGDADKQRLAREAIDEKLSVRELEKRVRVLRPKHRGGRPEKAAVVKWVEAVGRSVAVDGLEHARRELSELPPDQVKELEERLRRARAKLDEVVTLLERSGRGRK